MGSVPPEALVALLGLFSTVLGIVAGNNRQVIRAYQRLVSRLEATVDRLEVKVKDLESRVDELMRRLSTKSPN